MDFAALNSYGTGGLLEPANVDKETLLSWMLWVFSGFVSLGALASEVKDARTYIWAIAILIPVVLAMNTMPFVVSLSADATRANYDAGHFATVAESFDYGGGANGWLEWALQVGATCCYVGMYNGCFVLAERGLYFLCELHFAERLERWGASRGSKAARWLFSTVEGTRRIYCIVNTGILLACSALPYGIIVEMSILVFTVTAVFFVAAFVRLKFVEPELPRPFESPGGKVGTVVIALPVLALCCFNIWLQTRDTARIDRNTGDDCAAEEPLWTVCLPAFFKVYSLGGLALLGLLVDLCATLCGRGEQEEALNSMTRKSPLKSSLLADGSSRWEQPPGGFS